MGQGYTSTARRAGRDRRRRALLSALPSIASIAMTAGCCEARTAPQPFDGRIDPEGTEPFAIVGDLQKTSLIEFWREENDYERGLIVRRIANERPSFLVILGDLVSNGSSASAWADFDALCAPIRDAHIPVFAVPGNHEYWVFRGDLDNYFDRFPHLNRQSHYELRYGALGLVFLNSNKDQLSPEAWAAQRRWYERALARLDADPAIRGVFVMLHHPPFTNSLVTRDEEPIKREIVPAFLAAKKTLAMITGHVHSYEHFERNGKTFLVSGGGGGPRAEIARGSRRRHTDDLYQGPGIRNFHYLSVAPSAAGLTISVVALHDGGGPAGDDFYFSPIDTIEIPWATRAPSIATRAPSIATRAPLIDAPAPSIEAPKPRPPSEALRTGF